MNPVQVEKTIPGTYFWELIFSYDNSTNTGEITDKLKYTRKRTINYETTLTESFKITSRFSLKEKLSATLLFKGVTVGADAEFNHHLETANDLTRTSNSSEKIEEELIREQEFIIGPGGKLEIYRLCYLSSGVVYKTDVLATAKKAEARVELAYICRLCILGLEEISNQLRETRPQRDNIAEWNNIRNTIISTSDKDEETSFKALVTTLSQTNPTRENIWEWNSIRTTSNEILTIWDQTPKQLLMRKLLTQLSTIVPGRANTFEWAAIRSVANELLTNIKTVY